MDLTVVINGKKENIKDGTSISGLLADKNIRPEVVTVELNEVILERPKYSGTFLKHNDRIEFVYYMGGGHAF